MMKSNTKISTQFYQSLGKFSSFLARCRQSCQDLAEILKFTNITLRSWWNLGNLSKNVVRGLWTDMVCPYYSRTMTADCHSVPALLIMLLEMKLGDVKITTNIIGKKFLSLCWSAPALSYDKVFFIVVVLLPGEGGGGEDSLTKNKMGAYCYFLGV